MPQIRHFTFGQNHMTNFPLPRGGRIADYWVTVELPDDYEPYHPRQMFIGHFTNHYCPSPMQFAMEYEEGTLDESFFPGGELCRITENGIQK